jgi:hypothetical protein
MILGVALAFIAADDVIPQLPATATHAAKKIKNRSRLHLSFIYFPY